MVLHGIAWHWYCGLIWVLDSLFLSFSLLSLCRDHPSVLPLPAPRQRRHTWFRLVLRTTDMSDMGSSSGAVAPNAATVAAELARTRQAERERGAEAGRQTAAAEAERMRTAAAAALLAREAALRVDPERPGDEPGAAELEEEAAALAIVAAIRQRRAAAAAAAVAAAAQPPAPPALALGAYAFGAALGLPQMYAGRLVFDPRAVATARQQAVAGLAMYDVSARRAISASAKDPGEFSGDGAVGAAGARALEQWLESLHRWFVGTFLYGAGEDDRPLAQIASTKLIGSAARWWIGVPGATGAGGVTLAAFETGLRMRFQPRGSEEAAFESFRAVAQTGGLQPYIAEFQQRLSLVPAGLLTEAGNVAQFNAGLKPTLRAEVRRAGAGAVAVNIQEAINRAVYANSLLTGATDAPVSHASAASARGAGSSVHAPAAVLTAITSMDNDGGWAGEANYSQHGEAALTRVVRAEIAAMYSERRGGAGESNQGRGGHSSGRGAPGGAGPQRWRGGQTKGGSGRGGKRDNPLRPPNLPEGGCSRCWKTGHYSRNCLAEICPEALAWNAILDKRFADNAAARNAKQGEKFACLVRCSQRRLWRCGGRTGDRRQRRV